MKKTRIGVVVASIREGRVGSTVGNWFMDAVKDNPDVECELIDLKEYPVPLYADAMPAGMRQGKHENPQVDVWLSRLEAVDGFIFILPEYNHSLPGAFKNALDYVFPETHNKPMGIVSYGSIAAGSRSAEHLRQIAAEMQMFDIRNQILIPFAWAAFDEDGKMKEYNDQNTKTANAMVSQLAEISTKLSEN